MPALCFFGRVAIVSWKHKGLKVYFETGSTKGIRVYHSAKLRRILSLLDEAKHADELRLPGFSFHLLEPKKSGICAVTVNGNWRVTFRFVNENAEIVDYLDYH